VKIESDLPERDRLTQKWNTTVATITTPTYDVGVAGMAPVILLVFFAAIIFVTLGLVDVG